MLICIMIHVILQWCAVSRDNYSLKVIIMAIIIHGDIV